MKKFLLLTSMIVVTSVANAQTEYYFSTKLGLGDTKIYVDDDNDFEDYIIKSAERNTGLTGFEYDDSGLLWELSPAVGIDWTINDSGWFHIRLEGELGYNHYHEGGKLTYNHMVSDKVNVDFNDIIFLVNGYADFRIDKIIPYVGVGFGHAWVKQKMTIKNVFGEFSSSYNDHGRSTALHLGVAYKYSDITTFDFGIRSVYVPFEDDGAYIYTTARLGARFRM